MNRGMYVLKRLILGIPVILFGLTMAFLILVLSPIDPATAILGRDAQASDILRLQIALNIRYPNGEMVPLWDRYVRTMWDVLTFDFGQSWTIQDERPVLDLILARMPATLWLGFWSVVVALFVGIPVGLYAGLKSNTWGDYLASGGGILWRAMPNFWLAVMISGMLTAGGALSWYRGFLIKTDVIGTPDSLNHMFDGIELLSGVPLIDVLWIPVPNFWPLLSSFKWILPAALVLGSASMGNEVRIGRTAVLESINSKYIDTAKAKGLSSWRIIGKHVGRNAVLPLLPVIMGEFYLLIGGSVIVESIFAINGMGLLFLQAVTTTDIPVVMALVFIFAIILVLFNIVQDILYTFIDPRITLEEADR